MRGIGFAAWALLLAVPVQAQPMRVVVTLPECNHPSWSDAELLGSLGVELRSDGVFELARDAPSLAAVGWLTVEEACDPTRATVTLGARSATGPRATRAMSLADVPAELHARAIALALAELWRGSWLAPAAAADAATETQAREQPRAEFEAASARETDESPPPKAAEPRPHERASQLRAASTSAPALSLGPALRLFAQRTTLLYGARAAFRGFDCEFGTAASLASRTDPLGTLNYGVAQLFAAYDLVRIHAGDYDFTASPRLALGFSWGTARATATSDASSAMDLVWDVAAQLMLSKSFDEDWRLALVIASGYARGPRYEAEREQVSLAGLFADAALAVLWQFGD